MSIEADTSAYFDGIGRKMLVEFLRQRIADESLVRFIGKRLRVVVLDGTEYTADEGSPGLGALAGAR